MKIFKSLTIILGIIFLFIVLLSVATFVIVKHIRIKDLIEYEIEQQLGINVTIKELGCSPFLTHIFAKGITIHNPPGFKGEELAYIKAIHLVWDPGDMIILKKPSIYVCGVNLERLNVIKNEKGKVNIEELMPVQNQWTISQDGTPFFFDILVLSIGDVKYTEYTASSVKTHTYHINIKNKPFVLLQDENEVIKLIIYNAIQNTDIGRLVHLTVTPVFSGVSNTFDSAWGTAKVGTKSAWEIATMPFKLIFGK
jgi:hypothetical protein